MSETDKPPQAGSFRRYGYNLARGVAFLRGRWGRRIFGTINLFGDLIAEGMNQVFYSRLPGHPQQAEDSLTQSARDRGLVRFRGETLSAFITRVSEAWDDYTRGATRQQLFHVINQWGHAGWPRTWGTEAEVADAGMVTIVESSDPLVFEFTVTIFFGLIDPPWIPVLYGDGHVYGEFGLFYGIGPSTDIPMLLFLVRKWKRASSLAHVVIYYSATEFVTFHVG